MPQPRRIETRVIRRGDPAADAPDVEWLRYTPAERIEAVWTLTKTCLAWGGGSDDELRLQRSVSRVQRPPR